MLTNAEINVLASIVARRIDATPGLAALNAWTNALHALMPLSQWVKAVDMSWPLVRDTLEAAEFNRRAA